VDFAEYQARAAQTDQQERDGERRLVVAMLGLAGEVGTLLSEHKKWLRDGEAHDRRTGVAEDLGDILWYLAAAASTLGIDLGHAAEANLAKVADRWPRTEMPRTGPYDVPLPPGEPRDATFADEERLPRFFQVTLAPLPEDPSRVVGVLEDGSALGNLLGDNAYNDDGYRWHDVLHLGHAAVLGWSPVVRMLLGRKRKTDALVDDVEDGGRAIAIEEGISAAVFDYASQRRWLEGLYAVDSSLLDTLRGLTRGLEVRSATALEWEQAVLRGFGCWRELRAADGGVVTCDLDARSIKHRPLTADERARHADSAREAINRRLR
jgi:NTP pyrophosphatase (non-canonical NTP hydrolase)